MSYLEDYIARLNILPEQSNRKLRLIRELDKKAHDIQKSLEAKQKQFIDRAQDMKNKKDNKQRDTLEKFYKEIISMHRECHAISQDKVRLADELYNLIHEPTEKLDIDLKKMKTDLKDDHELHDRDPKGRKVRGNKKKLKRRKEEPTEPNEPRYCYCGKPSYGQMVECENSLCENEWFHIGCIQEKVLPEKWYCLNCRKGNDSSARALRHR